MELMKQMENTIKGGLINGPILYATGKLVDVSDQAAFNMIGAGLPDMVRTPLVGLALATLPLALSDHWLAEKASEYAMANAVASAITVAGAAPGMDSGPIDTQVNAMLLPVANIGLPAGAAPFTAATFWGNPTMTTRGYIDAGGRSNGYVGATARVQRSAGYIGATKGAPGINGAPGIGTGGMAGGMRSNRLRGYTTELR